MEELQQQQYPNQIECAITQDIEEKLKNLDEFAHNKSDEQVLQIRRHQLGLSKVLVLIHSKPIIFLINAHCKLGEAYLVHKYYEQAIEHLTTALKKNIKGYDKLDSQKYHAHILTLLGKAYFEMENIKDAQELLLKALEMTQLCYGEDDINCASIMILISNCHAYNGDYDQALDYISKVWDLSQAKYGSKSESCALVYLECAKIHNKKEDFEKAVDYQKRALDRLVELNVENNPEYVANLYSTLGTYQQKNNDIDGYIDSIDKVKKIYRDIYGELDKKTIKITKVFASILLKNNRNEEALVELLEIEQLQSKLYGEESIELAKTLKIIGAVYLVQSNFIDAQRFFNRALHIFEKNGIKQAVQDLRKKIKVAREMRTKSMIVSLSDAFQ